MNDKMTPKDALATARAICNSARMGQITYDECKERCAPYLKIVNDAGKELAKKFGRRWTPIRITGLLR